MLLYYIAQFHVFHIALYCIKGLVDAELAQFAIWESGDCGACTGRHCVLLLSEDLIFRISHLRQHTRHLKEEIAVFQQLLTVLIFSTYDTYYYLLNEYEE